MMMMMMIINIIYFLKKQRAGSHHACMLLVFQYFGLEWVPDQHYVWCEARWNYRETLLVAFYLAWFIQTCKPSPGHYSLASDEPVCVNQPWVSLIPVELASLYRNKVSVFRLPWLKDFYLRIFIEQCSFSSLSVYGISAQKHPIC